MYLMNFHHFAAFTLYSNQMNRISLKISVNCQRLTRLILVLVLMTRSPSLLPSTQIRIFSFSQFFVQSDFVRAESHFA